MDKERLKKMVENPDFIPGSYNYCDRWCEKCALTSRCMNFALERRFFQDQQDLDQRNTEFWQSISEILETTVGLLHDLARLGISRSSHGDPPRSLDLASLPTSSDLYNISLLGHIFPGIGRRGPRQG